VRAAGALEFTLSDGRRFALRAQRPADRLDLDARPMSAQQLFGDELAARLAASPVRTLNLQLDGALDAFAWEAVSLGNNGSLGERFALARQLLSDAEPIAIALPTAPLAEALAVAVVQGRHAPLRAHAACIAIDALDTESAREAVAQAHVRSCCAAPTCRAASAWW
jgi:hypothetical protein